MIVHPLDSYADFAGDITALLDEARRQAARSVNAILTATYWEIGRRIVEFEQGGKQRAEYGEELLARLSQDLTARFGRGFSVDSLERMRAFYLAYPPDEISASLMRKSIASPFHQTSSAESTGGYLGTTGGLPLSKRFPQGHAFAHLHNCKFL